MQFSLRHMFLVLTVVGIAMFFVKSFIWDPIQADHRYDSLLALGAAMSIPEDGGITVCLGRLAEDILPNTVASPRSIHTSDADLKRLIDFKDEIEWLGLVETAITDEGLVHISQLANLKGISLRGTAVTDVGLKYIAKLNKLELLDLSETRVTKVGIADLKRALPNTTVLFRKRALPRKIAIGSSLEISEITESKDP